MRLWMLCMVSLGVSVANKQRVGFSSVHGKGGCLLYCWPSPPTHTHTYTPTLPLISPVFASVHISQGQIKELDAAAAAFMAAAPSARSALLADARAAADEIDVSSSPDAPAYIEYYIRVMQRVLDKGDAYVEQVCVCVCVCVFG
jgi:Endoplasmic reticulum protein ERp29, C-terminal domain